MNPLPYFFEMRFEVKPPRPFLGLAAQIEQEQLLREVEELIRELEPETRPERLLTGGTR